MAKQTSRLDLVLPPRPAGVPYGRWLYSSLRELILAGRLPPGTWLPSSRDLARQYGLARGTVVEALEALRWEGYLEAKVGAGTRVSPTLPDGLLAAPRARTAAVTPPVPGRPGRSLSRFAGRLQPLGNLAPGPVRAFRTDQPALDLFPLKLWTQLASRRLKQASTDLWLSCHPLGFPPLRQAIADYLVSSRGVRCEAAQVAIVSGTQEALDLAARLVLDPGSRVALECPGYEGAQRVFAAAGAELAEVPVDAEGMVVDPARLAGARLVYVTPAHQYPLGMAMSLPRRLALLDWAGAHSALVFEDDYDSEFRYTGRPLPALQGLDSQAQVLFAGTFSKVLLPSLRLGYLVLPSDLVDRFATLQSITRRHAPVLEQAVLADFMAGGHFGRHVRRMREVYAERLGVLQAAAREELAGGLELTGIEAGLQTIGWLAPGLSAERVAAAATRRQVEVRAVALPAAATPDPAGRQGLHLGFAAVRPGELRRGVSALARVLAAERPP